ncbi:urease accessory protein UreD [Roseovarius sp. CAU 1744]|uniref:urease accessory protein UreD n=1 Tax=Roseovarius sp. CAU 1744 TaxID=3140368 RepID=UPI00325AFC33
MRGARPGSAWRFGAASGQVWTKPPTQRPDITAPSTICRADATAVQPRARGSVAVSAKLLGADSAIDGLRQAGSLKCLFPRVQGNGLQAVLINTAGGVTGDDVFSLDAAAGPGTRLTLTTQAAERAYRAQPGQSGLIETRLFADKDAQINWLPQETILFDGAALSRSLVLDLAPGARALYCEPLVFGRRAMGETLRSAAFRDRVEIRRTGTPLYRDGIDLAGDVAAHLARRHIADGAAAMATLVLVAPEAEARLDAVRALLPDTGGASLLRPDMLVARLLATDGYALRLTLVPILSLLLQESLPRCWMI